jgi:hypothetical protein
MKQSFVKPNPEQPPVRAPWLLETVAVLLLLVNMFLSGAIGARSSRSGPELLGAMFAPAIIGLLVVGIASAFKGARNRTTRAKIVLVTMVVMLLGNFGKLGPATRPATSAGAPPAQPR